MHIFPVREENIVVGKGTDESKSECLSENGVGVNEYPAPTLLQLLNPS
jgi:hypothetical protein